MSKKIYIVRDLRTDKITDFGTGEFKGKLGRYELVSHRNVDVQMTNNIVVLTTVPVRPKYKKRDVKLSAFI